MSHVQVQMIPISNVVHCYADMDTVLRKEFDSVVKDKPFRTLGPNWFVLSDGRHKVMLLTRRSANSVDWLEYVDKVQQMEGLTFTKFSRGCKKRYVWEPVVRK